MRPKLVHTRPTLWAIAEEAPERRPLLGRAEEQRSVVLRERERARVIWWHKSAGSAAGRRLPPHSPRRRAPLERGWCGRRLPRPTHPARSPRNVRQFDRAGAPGAGEDAAKQKRSIRGDGSWQVSPAVRRTGSETHPEISGIPRGISEKAVWVGSRGGETGVGAASLRRCTMAAEAGRRGLRSGLIVAYPRRS